jgi:hypothetical protein
VLPKKKILQGYFLLTLYLLVLSHHCAFHSHTQKFDNPSESKKSHQHENFNDVHHDHQFHVGIFHFIGHLLEKISHSDDLADEHLFVVQKSSDKKNVDDNNSLTPYIQGQQLLVFEVDAESLLDPPYYLFLLQKLKLPSTPPRAPPSLV